MRRPALLLPLALVLAGCRIEFGDDGPAGPDRLDWRGTVPAGGWVRIRDVNGAVQVGRAPGREVIITATRRARGARPETVRLIAHPDADGGVTACALWGDGGRCADGQAESRVGKRNVLARLFNRRSAVRVDFVVAVPAGVRVDAENVNGAVTIADAAGEVKAETVNGSITVAATGAAPVRAETVNGSVRAMVQAPAPGTRIALETVNGSVTALLPPGAAAQVALETTNGRASSDLPVTTTQTSRRELAGTIGSCAGAGCAAVSLKSVNGSVTLGRL